MIRRATLHFLLLVCSVRALGKTYVVGVRGKLVCHGKALGDVPLRLYDGGITLHKEHYGHGRSAANGTFEFVGQKKVLAGHVHPRLNASHHCGDAPELMTACPRTAQFRIPKDFPARDSEPVKFFDFGELELADDHAATVYRKCWLD